MSVGCLLLGGGVIGAAFVVQVVVGHKHRLGTGEFITILAAGALIALLGVALRMYRLKRIHQTLRYIMQAADADDDTAGSL